MAPGYFDDPESVAAMVRFAGANNEMVGLSGYLLVAPPFCSGWGFAGEATEEWGCSPQGETFVRMSRGLVDHHSVWLCHCSREH